MIDGMELDQDAVGWKLGLVYCCRRQLQWSINRLHVSYEGSLKQIPIITHPSGITHYCAKFKTLHMITLQMTQMQGSGTNICLAHSLTSVKNHAGSINP